MLLRDRRDNDLDELAARVQALDGYPIHLPDRDFVRFLTTPTPVAAWVAVHDDRMVGTVALNAETSAPVMRLAAEVVPAGRAIYVARLLVDPSVRGLGLGRALLDCARRAAVDRGRVTFHEDIEELVFRGPGLPTKRSSAQVP